MAQKTKRFKIGILGFGREGRSVLKYIRTHGLMRTGIRINTDFEIWVLDKNQSVKIPNGIHSCLGKNYLSPPKGGLKNFDIIFRSPGIPYNLPHIQKAIKKGVEISSATKLFFERLKSKTNNLKPFVIGVTGTKGKGTTSVLLYKILKACDRNAYLAGNIGRPAIEILPKLKRDSIAVLELSSFQLQDMEQSPDIAIITEIFPDHLDAHKNFKEYIFAKAAIAKFQNQNDKVFYFADNRWSKWIAYKSRGKKIAVDLHSHQFNLEKLRRIIKIPGEHNLKNALMAMTVAKYLGCPEKIIWKTVAGFRGLPHRLEFVRAIRNISFYNDSASTNPNTVAAAVASFRDPVILIAGGQDKNLNYKSLAQAIKKSGFVKTTVLFGENKNKIKKQIASAGGKTKLQIVLRNNLKSAVKTAYLKAKSLKLKAVALFSPGAASFDMFRDYADRGEKFKNLVKRLK